ncbi:hypothetical protein [Enterobacter hormaechei]|uniref:hypothetical protein n=1 Tax=Enterobacter hormaechei TaxID=158836 RepID=UPI00389053DF
MTIEYKITLWAMACAYAIGTSFLYSWAFWSVFDINILQFASFSEIFPSILYTITIPCILVIIAFSAVNLWEYFYDKINDAFERHITSKLKHFEIAKNLLLVIVIITNLVAGAFSTFKAYKDPTPTPDFPWSDFFQAMIPFAIAIIAIFLISKKTTFLMELKIGRKLAIFIICFIPVACYLWGHVNSTKIMNGRDTLLVQSDGQCKSAPNTQYRYISSISDKAFAMSLSDGSICIFKYNSLKLTPEKHSVKLEPLGSNRV